MFTNIWPKIFIFLTGLLIILEFSLRIGFGFCDAVLMKESNKYEYIAQPNQSRHRFGNNILYNSLSMRSKEVDTSALKILCFGDSVINGGVLTDQDSLATTILSAKLSEMHDRSVQFLNISAGSWGPDNCFAYLKENGAFRAKLMFLFVNSHDAYDNMNFEKVIDIHRSYPSQQYSFALYELWDRYLYPRLSKPKINASSANNALGINKKNVGTPFNPGFQAFVDYSADHNIPLVVYLHAEKSELERGNYNQQGQEILRFLKNNKVPVITDLNSGLKEDHFSDGIHLNQKGQQNIASNIIKSIETKQISLPQVN